MTKRKKDPATTEPVLFVRVKPEMKEAIRKAAEQRDLSQEQMVRAIVRQWLEAQP
jgi:uncharacterized protein (DUF1778 family)